MTNPQVLMKLVDGVEMPLTPEEVTELEERRIVFEAQAPLCEARQGRFEGFTKDTERTELMARLRSHTVAELDTWIDSQVTDLSSARRMFKIILRVLANVGPL